MDDVTRLALAARGGDEAALAAFVRRTQGAVWRLAAHLVDRASADDLTQDTYLRAVPALARYRGDAPAEVWLLAIARRTCADEIRRRSRRRRVLDRAAVAAATGTGPHAVHVPGDEGAVDLLDLVGRLDPDRRAAFVLTQVLGLDYAAAAEVCDVPVGTIRSRVARARADLLRAEGGGEAAAGA